MARQCAQQGFVAVRRRRHIAHGMGNLIDLSSDLGGGLEHRDVELDVVALDRGTHTRGPSSDDSDIVE